MGLTATKVKVNPLDKVKASSPLGRGFKIPTLPRLASLISDAGFKDGIQQFDEGMDDWAQALEKAINERLASSTVSPSIGA